MFVFDHEGYDADRRVAGTFRAVNPTRFAERFRRLGIPLPELLGVPA